MRRYIDLSIYITRGREREAERGKEREKDTERDVCVNDDIDDGTVNENENDINKSKNSASRNSPDSKALNISPILLFIHLIFVSPSLCLWSDIVHVWKCVYKYILICAQCRTIAWFSSLHVTLLAIPTQHIIFLWYCLCVTYSFKHHFNFSVHLPEKCIFEMLSKTPIQNCVILSHLYIRQSAVYMFTMKMSMKLNPSAHELLWLNCSISFTISWHC